MIYIYLYIQCFFYIFFKKSLKIKDNIFVYFILPFILCFFYINGVDWRVYNQLYVVWLEDVKFLDVFTLNIPIEKGYIIISWIFRKIISYELFNGLLLLSCYYIIISKLKKYSKNFYVSLSFFLTMFLISNFMEPAIRQIIALAIYLLTLDYIEKEKIYKYLIGIFLASIFHKSIIILLPVYFLNKFKISKKQIVIIYVIIFFLIKNLKAIVTNLSAYLFFLNKYLVYFENEYSLALNQSFVKKSITIIECIIFLIIIIKYYSKENKNYIYNAAIISVLLKALSNQMAILYRVNDYFEFFLVCAISSIYDKGNKVRQIVLIFMMLLNFLIFYRDSQNAKYRYYPYTNYIIEVFKGTLYENLQDKLIKKEELINKEKEIL